jgi:hypothetical protein
MILYAKEGIYAKQAKEDAQEDVQELTATERAKQAIERANEVMASDKPEPEPLSAYDEYKALQLCKPVQAGEFWRSHKHEILACKFTD